MTKPVVCNVCEDIRKPDGSVLRRVLISFDSIAKAEKYLKDNMGKTPMSIVVRELH